MERESVRVLSALACEKRTAVPYGRMGDHRHGNYIKNEI